jgi:hypothetical protein
MISDNSEVVPSAVPVLSAESGGNGSGEWLTVEAAAHLLGCTKRAVRRWASLGTVTARKDPHTASWEVRADTLPKPRDSRALRPRPRSAPPESPAVLALSASLKNAYEKVVEYAGMAQYWRAQAEATQKMLPESTASAERWRDQVERLRRRDARLSVEVAVLAVVALVAVLV